MIKQYAGHVVALVVAHEQTAAIVGLALLWLLEQILAATDRVHANSIVQAIFNFLYARARLRFPLVARLGNIAAELEAEAEAAKSAPSSPPPPPAVPPAAVLLVLLSAALLAASGCATFKACTIGKLGSDAQIVSTAVQAIVSNPGSTTADLEQAAFSFAPGLVDCAAQALVAYWAAKPEAAPALPAGTDVKAALMAASSDAQRTHALDVLQRYLTQHKPTACAAPPRG
jgi:hypothetical protein